MEAFIGTVLAWPPNFAPRYWALCNGQLLQIANNQALYSLLGSTYGGDGRTTFALPDLRGRVIVGQGQAPGMSAYSLGEKGGSESVTLSTQEIPAHNHAAQANSLTVHPVYSTVNAARATPQAGDVPAKVGLPDGRDFNAQNAYGNNTNTINGAAISISGEVHISNTGGNLPHDNRQPYQVLNWIIALQGIYPSRD